MDWQFIGQGATYLIMVMGGWILKTLWSAQREMAADLAKLREELPKEYVSKPDFKESIAALFKKLDYIAERLDRREDKGL